MKRCRNLEIKPVLRPLAGAILLALAAVAQAQVLPTGGVVHSGSADIVTNGSAMTINQTTRNAILHWGTFDIGAGDSVRFNQPDAASIALNRVLGATPSGIFGTLAANGRVFLINPNGVLFGATAQVNVGGLVASTLAISDADFAAGAGSGRFIFSAPDESVADVDNFGALTAGGQGTIALLGGQVSNAGSIVANGGTVALVSSQRVTLDFFGDGLTQVTIAMGTDDGGIINSGSLQADGGLVQLITQTDDGAPGGFGGFITHTGVIRAQSLANRNGRIVLDAGAGNVNIGFDGDLTTGATVDATGLAAGRQGGEIDIRGDSISIVGSTLEDGTCGAGAACTVIDASGHAGGGDIALDSVYSMGLLGFDEPGSSASGMAIRSDATASGSGGSISFGNDGAARDGVAGGISFIGSTLVSAVGAGNAAGGAIRIGSDNGDVGVFDSFFISESFDDDLPVFIASGTGGGGSIDAETGGVLVIDAGVAMAADGLGSSDGGRVGLNGGSGLRAFGSLSARGGASGGNGGLIETSGGALDLRGIGIDASAPNGMAGTWLIDPFDVEITHGSASGSLPSDPFEAVASTIIQDGDINNALNAGTSVHISTGAVTAGAAGDGDVTFTADSDGVPVAIARTDGTAPLTFRIDANRAIRALEGLTIDAGDGPLNVLFNANANNTAVPTSEDAGIVLVDANIATNGGNFWLYGQSDAVNGLAGGEEEGIQLVDSTVDTRGVGGGGEVRMRGRGGNGGVEVLGSSIFSGAGAITVFGTTVFSGNGVTLASTDFDGSLLQSDSGNISITGLALQSFPGSSQVGVELASSAVATTSGTIDLFGRAQGTNGPSSPGSAVGILMHSGAEIVSVNGSRIRLVGESTLAAPSSAAFGAGVHLADTCGGDSGICINGGTAGQVVLQAGNTGASDALILDGTVQTAAAVNLRPGGVDTAGAAYDRVGDAIAVGGSGGGFAVSADEIGRITTPDLIFGSNAHAAAINVVAAISRAGNLSLHNASGSGGIAVNNALDVGTGTLALVSGGDITQTGAGAITAGSLLAQSNGGEVALSAAANNVSGSTLAGSAAGGFSYTDVDALTIGSVAALGFDAAGNAVQALGDSGVAGSDVFVRNLAGNLTLSAGATATGDIDLVTAGTLQNLGGATLSAGNRWRVWADTWVGETRGGLAGSGTLPNLYNCSFDGPCGVTVPAADNHFIYRQQPVATVSIDDATREYGLDNPAFTFGIAGLILGDQAVNAISGSPGTIATIASDVGNYGIDGDFQSPAGYLVEVLPGTLAITPATLFYVADPFARFVGLPNGLLSGSVTGFRNDDTLAGATSGTLLFTSPADSLSPVGVYAIDGSGLSATNYVFEQAPGNATALTVFGLPGRLVTPEVLREPPDNYIYDRNIGATAVCLVTDPFSTAQTREGDNLAREWSRVRSRPNLTNCVQSNKRNGCSDF